MEIELIQNKIHEIRDVKVMLDFDLAAMYQVETRVLNQSVKRMKQYIEYRMRYPCIRYFTGSN